MPDSTTLDERLRKAVTQLLNELLEGPPGKACFVLNPSDRGLLASLDALTADAASERPGGRSSVAAHVDHLQCGFQVMNRWLRGEDPWSDTDFAASWDRQQVDEDQWRRVRAALRDEASAWVKAVAQPSDLDDITLIGLIASAVHLAYHVGAIRQIQPATRGPGAKD